MILGRNKCVIKGATQQKVMPHEEFIDRIRKSLYFGGDTLDEDMEVSRPLADYASELFSEPHKGHSLHRLNRVTAGSVHATPCSLIMALIYLDRLNATDPGYVRRITPQELFIVSMMISTKFYAGHDEEIYLSDWAEDGNMNEDRLKQLELEFLSAINWNIYISNEQFFNKLSNIEKSLARREGLKRGWLTYGELMQMLPSFTLVKFLLNNITVMAVSYAASVMTIAGAFFLASQIPITSLHRMQQRKTTVGGVGVGDAATNLMTDTNVLPTPQDLLLTEDVRHNNSATSISDTAATSTTTTSLQIANASCRALNVEAELLKLERQYYEEALHEQLSRRHNEIVAGASNELLYNGFELTLLQRASNDATRNWLSLKEEYSDRHFNLLPDTHRPAAATDDAFSATTTNTFGYTPPLSAGAATAWPTLSHCADNLGNCTSSLFWNLLADAAESSIVRLPPFLWFKFM